MSSNKTFSTMVTNVSNEVRDTSSAFQAIIKVYLNNRMRDLITRLSNLNLFEAYRTVALTTVSGQRDYQMPYDYAGELIYAHDDTNNRTLDIIFEQELVQHFGANLTQQSTPIAVIAENTSTVRVQPASSSKLSISSNASGDITQSIFARGISGSAEFYETISLNGTTTAQSANNYDYILQLTKSATTTGLVTITYVTGGTTASIIAPESKTQLYNNLGMHYVPNGTYTITVRYKRDIKPMVDDNDTPIIDISDGLEKGAIADSWRYKRQFENADAFESLYEIWLDRLIMERMSNKTHQFDIIPDNRNLQYGYGSSGWY